MSRSLGPKVDAAIRLLFAEKKSADGTVASVGWIQEQLRTRTEYCWIVSPTPIIRVRAELFGAGPRPAGRPLGLRDRRPQGRRTDTAGMIEQMYADGETSYAAIGQALGVTDEYVGRVLGRKKHAIQPK